MIRQVKVKGRSYAVGLWWQVPPRPVDSRKAMVLQARQRAQQFSQEQYNTVALRRHQYGLGRADGKISSVPALAAALNPQALSFLGVFCLEGDAQEGLWWVCGIRQGSVAGDGDMTYVSYEEAHKASLKLLNVMRTCDQRLTCDTPEKSMDAIGAMLRSDAKLEPLYPVPGQARRRMLFAGGILAVVAAWIGGAHVLEQRAAREAHLNLQSRQAIQANRRAEIETNAGNYFDRPWETEPRPDALVASCVRDVLAVPLVSQGWMAESVDCTSTRLLITWAHQPGASYLRLPDKARLSSKNPRQAVSSLSRPNLPASEAAAPSLWDVAWATRVFAQLTQDAGIALRLPWDKPERKKVEGIEISAPWVKGRLELSSLPANLLVSGDLINRLANVPGLVITHITLSNDWSIQGVVYARP